MRTLFKISIFANIKKYGIIHFIRLDSLLYSAGVAPD